MERDAMIAQGASVFLRDRLFNASDKFYVPICSKCGVISSTREQCHSCKSSRIEMTPLPYASKLVFQELNALMINTKFLIK